MDQSKQAKFFSVHKSDSFEPALQAFMLKIERIELQYRVKDKHLVH